MLASLFFTGALAFASTCIGAAIRPRNIDPHTATVCEILRADTEAFFENVAVRENGHLLVTRLDIPSLYHIDPATGHYSIIANLTGVTGTFGIVEYAPDVFAVAIGNYTIATKYSTPGTWSLVTIDMNKGLDSHGKVTPTPLVQVPGAANLDGIAFRKPSTLYATDATGFQIWSIDIASSPPAVKLAVPRNDLFENNGGGRTPLGVNGLKWDERGQQLIFTNSNKMLVGKVPARGSGFGTPSKIASLLSIDGDDLDIEPSEGNFFVANKVDGVDYLSRDGRTQLNVTMKKPVKVDGPTATRFARGTKDNVLYVTTAGRNGNGTHFGGQVLSYTFDRI